MDLAMAKTHDGIATSHSKFCIQAIHFLLLGFISIASSCWGEDPFTHFENKIRPVLVKHCLECHGDDLADLGGGLSLLSRASSQAGGDAGPAIVPGKPGESLLLKALRYEGELDMPPDGRLPEAVINDFAIWIKNGAADPREDAPHSSSELAHTTSKLALAEAAAKKHWAFQPLLSSAILLGRDGASSKSSTNMIDEHVDQRLAAAGLQRSAPASAMTLLRRLHYDLTGLPPPPDLIRQFSRASHDLNYQRLVDRLLASDEFGRHWGRHWLDLARYADSNGSDFNATFHHAWRYRDYVIDSFNRDKPYDRFVEEQIAGDLMPAATDHQRAEQLIATGFLMLGPKMLSERDKAKLQMDVVDDQIDTIGRAMMGLTLGCARCHDHKFDPVPTSDYYALAGIFRSTEVLEGEIQKYVSDWIETPLPTDASRIKENNDFEQAEKGLVASIKKAEKRLKEAKSQAAENDLSIVIDDTAAKREGKWVASVYSRPFIGDGYLHDDNRDKGKATLTLATRLPAGNYQIWMAYTASPNRSRKTQVEIISHAVSTLVEVDQTKTPESLPWQRIGTLTSEVDEDVTIVIRNADSDGYVIADAVRFVRLDKDVASQPLEDVVKQIQAELDSANEGVKKLRAERPAPLPLAMAVRDAKQIGDTFICVRGEVGLRGETVSRGFLRIRQPDDSLPNAVASTSSDGMRMPTDQSGRLQLAHWICDPDHPLTARVIVNRVWMHLLGEGLVQSVDNLGVLGEKPSHPALLDALAVEFVRDGWSIKKLIRRIVMTDTYRQSTDYNETAMQVDPENRLLWRMHRKRLPAEALRDTLLFSAGELDSSSATEPMAQFGTLVSENVADPKVVAKKVSSRRAIFSPVIRGQVDELLSVFDFADPDLLVGRRERTNVPSQSLVMLNHPWIQQRSRQIAKEILRESHYSTEVLEAAFLKLYCHLPTEPQIRVMSAFLNDVNEDTVSEVVNAMIGSSEFRLLD